MVRWARGGEVRVKRKSESDADGSASAANASRYNPRLPPAVSLPLNTCRKPHIPPPAPARNSPVAIRGNTL